MDGTNLDDPCVGQYARGRHGVCRHWQWLGERWTVTIGKLASRFKYGLLMRFATQSDPTPPTRLSQV